MARKFGYGSTLVGFLCALLIGCQTGTGARVGQNSTKKGPAMAQQGTLPPPSFPGAGTPTTSGLRNNPPASANGFGTATNNTYPLPQNVTPTSGLAPAPGPQAFGAPTPSNRSNEVVYTQPGAPIMPPLPPGIQPIP